MRRRQLWHLLWLLAESGLQECKTSKANVERWRSCLSSQSKVLQQDISQPSPAMKDWLMLLMQTKNSLTIATLVHNRCSKIQPLLAIRQKCWGKSVPYWSGIGRSAMSIDHKPWSLVQLQEVCRTWSGMLLSTDSIPTSTYRISPIVWFPSLQIESTQQFDISAHSGRGLMSLTLDDRMGCRNIVQPFLAVQGRLWIFDRCSVAGLWRHFRKGHNCSIVQSWDPDHNHLAQTSCEFDDAPWTIICEGSVIEDVICKWLAILRQDCSLLQNKTHTWTETAGHMSGSESILHITE